MQGGARLGWAVLFMVSWAGLAGPALGQDGSSLIPTVEDGSLTAAESPQQVATVLVTVAMLTILTLSPSLLIMTTCFTRVVIVFGFLRRALATQQLPPNPVIMGMALFLTLFIMYPTWEKSWSEGIGPYIDGERDPDTGDQLTQTEAFRRTMAPVRVFMFRCLEANEGRDEVDLFLQIAGHEVPEEYAALRREDVPTHVLIPAFITSELKRAFWMGFLLYLPFLVVDMIISSVLMSMGMMMLPPVMVSLPFKVVLFVLVDGWSLLVQGLVMSFPLVGAA